MIARNEAPIHQLISSRTTSRAFSTRPVPAGDLRAVLEAARWAASSYNAQPWRFVVARREDASRFESILSALMPVNREWASTAPVLIVTVARANFPHNEKPNRHAWHDVGLATGNLMMQAEALGLVTGTMGGFDPKAAREKLHIPDGWEPVAVIALGYPANEEANAGAGAHPAKPRERKPLEEIVYGGDWGKPVQFASEDEDSYEETRKWGTRLAIQ
ncbi:MAG: nitroreductase family protein [Candidatus Acidiferrales bacterium]